jgi:hypothetical protein
MVETLYTNQMLGYKQIALYLTVKQKGLCHQCNEQIQKLSPIVRKNGKRPRYYHVDCAKKIRLI